MSTTGSATQSPLHLRVFLASPGDVADERGTLHLMSIYLEQAKQVIEEIHRCSGFFV